MVEFRSDKCTGFLEHWISLRAGNDLVPQQSAFLDHPHPLYAPYIHIAEIVGTDLIFRLMGTALVERWGRDKTGEKVGIHQPEPIRSALLGNSELAIEQPNGFKLVIEFASTTGTEMAVEAIVLPLAVEDDKPLRLVSFSDVLQTLKFGDHSETYLGLPTVDWIDIGAGVPKQAPTTSPRP